ncbi:hypothetical protein NESM_000849800 [Novymonas esmeraldas]|uniref:Uncharacterized protein n=1 Tax=Novymonas esmeraldas TaxID=1808958 RepID=A0AAW0EXT3_9TRYP
MSPHASELQHRRDPWTPSPRRRPVAGRSTLFPADDLSPWLATSLPPCASHNPSTTSLDDGLSKTPPPSHAPEVITELRLEQNLALLAASTESPSGHFLTHLLAPPVGADSNATDAAPPQPQGEHRTAWRTTCATASGHIGRGSRWNRCGRASMRTRRSAASR